VPSGAFVARRNGKVFVTGNSGFPKSLDVSKAIDAMMGAEREVVESIPDRWAGKGSVLQRSTQAPAQSVNITAPATEAARQWSGFGTALKPSIEPVVCARKPLDGTVAENVLKWGTGAINVDGCRVAAADGYTENFVTQGVNTARTSYEPRRERRTFEPATAGRWPANIIHDGSEEVLAVFPETGPASAGVRDPNGTMGYHGGAAGLPGVVSGHSDAGGSAARFFYAAKAPRAEREHGLDALPRGIVDPTRELDSAGRDNPRTGAGRSGEGRANIHPTVKPVDLMRYLTRLVTPPGGLVVDPYAGSGTTGVAAIHEGFRFMGAEQDTAHALIAVTRIEQAVADEQEARTLATMQITLF
jgi:site-specific DNA-methyltransferase (adenine-specific)